MARSFAGGTDRLNYGGTTLGATKSLGGCHFRMKTTQVTVNAVPLSLWTAGSRSGIGFLLNNTLNKMTVQCYGGTGTPAISMTSSQSVNDGAWHDIVLNWNMANGGNNALYIDGAAAVNANAGAAWFGSVDSLPYLGDSNDPFWPSFVGEIAELAYWFDRQLVADEIAALAKGFSPLSIFPPGAGGGLAFYAPLVRDAEDHLRGGSLSSVGTTVSDHPRIIGL